MRTIAVLTTGRSRRYHANPGSNCISLQRSMVVTLQLAQVRRLTPCSECWDIRGYIPTDAPAGWELDT